MEFFESVIVVVGAVLILSALCIPMWVQANGKKVTQPYWFVLAAVVGFILILGAVLDWAILGTRIFYVGLVVFYLTLILFLFLST